MPAITTPENPAAIEPASDPLAIPFLQPNRFECRVTDFSGAYSYGIPAYAVTSASWQIERYGGYGSFNMTVSEHAVTDLIDVRSLPTYARVEFWVDGRCRYRGYITKPIVQIAEVNSYQVSGFGLSVIAGEYLVRKNFVYPESKDISQIFADVSASAIQDRYEALSITSDLIGMTRDSANYRGKTLKESFDQIVSDSANACVWGFYHSEVDYTQFARAGVERSLALHYRPNTLEFGPLSSLDSPDHAFMIPSYNVTAAQGEQDWTKVINFVTLRGGERLNPNLFYNGDFSRLVPAGGGLINLIPNGNFEEGGSGWSGGGFYQEANGTRGNPFSGKGMWQIDHTNEALERTITGLTLTPDESYRFAFRYRAEKQAVPNVLRVWLKWRYDNGTESSNEIDVTFTNNSAYWDIFESEVVVPTPPSGRTIVGIHIKINNESGATSNAGTLIDAVEFYPSGAVVQDGWELIQVGSARIRSQNWKYSDSPIFDDSGYCLAVTTTSSDSNSNDVTLRMRNESRWSVRPGEQIRVMFHVKKPDWYSGTSPKLILEYKQWQSDNGGKTTTSFSIPTGAIDNPTAATLAGGVSVGRGWYKFEFLISSLASTAVSTAVVRIRGNGSLLFDCFCARNAEELLFCPDGNYELRTSSANGNFNYSAIGVSPERESLIVASPQPENYNIRETVISIPSINNDNDAYRYLERYFNQHALPEDNPRVTVKDYDEIVRPGQCVYIGGDFGLELLSRYHTVARVSETWTQDGHLVTDIDLNREVPDEAAYQIELIDRRIRRQQFSGASQVSPGAASSSAGGVGGSLVDGIYSRNINTGTGLTGGGDLTADRTISLANTAVTPGSYTNASITVDAQGRLTAASDGSTGGVSFPILISQGGTSATNAPDARTNLGLGTSAVLDVASSGNASSTQVVKGNDTRLDQSEVVNARTEPSASPLTAGSTYANLKARLDQLLSWVASLYNRTISAGTGLSGGGDLTANRTISLANTAVTPGSYTNTNLTVDAQGRITAASNGSGGGGSTVRHFTRVVLADQNLMTFAQDNAGRYDIGAAYSFWVDLTGIETARISCYVGSTQNVIGSLTFDYSADGGSTWNPMADTDALAVRINDAPRNLRTGWKALQTAAKGDILVRPVVRLDSVSGSPGFRSFNFSSLSLEFRSSSATSGISLDEGPVPPTPP